MYIIKIDTVQAAAAGMASFVNWRPLLVLLALLAVNSFFPQKISAAEASSGRQDAAGVEITGFRPAEGTYRRGEKVYSELRVKNSGAETRAVWVGYSVRDAGGAWHDADCTGPVSVASGSVSKVIRLAWSVPDEKKFAGGQFMVRMAIWSSRPGSPGAERLGCAEKAFAFYSSNRLAEKKISISGIKFKVTPEKTKPLGNRGKLIRKNVEVSGGRAELTIARGSFDGGELESASYFSYGTFTASIKTPGAPGGNVASASAGSPFRLKSVTGFFLFDPLSEDEITVELFNDGSKRIWFSAFCRGEQTAHSEAILEFDPAGDFHEYAIDYSPARVDFLVDARIVCSLPGAAERIPAGGRMKIFFNSWFPSWKEFRPLLPGDVPPEDFKTVIKEVKYRRSISAGGKDEKTN
jgi:hypothetical protein